KSNAPHPCLSSFPTRRSSDLPEVGKVFRAEIVEIEANQALGQRVFVDGESIGPYVTIRNWKPGDYYRPVVLPAGKLKKLFQRARDRKSTRLNSSHEWISYAVF